MGAPPYKINGNFIRWEPYHIKQMGTLSDGNPTGEKDFYGLHLVMQPVNNLGLENLNEKTQLLLYRFEIYKGSV